MNRSSFIAFIVFASLQLSSCSEPVPPKATWSGTLSLVSGKQLPFRCEMELMTEHPSVVFLNGDERTVVTEVRLRGDSIIVEFPEYRAAMKGLWDGTAWKGEFFRYRSETLTNTFTASPIAAKENTAPAMRSSLRLSGRFRILAESGAGTDSSQVGTFWTRGDSTFGTFIAPDGDLGLFGGKEENGIVVLNRFTGWQATRMEVRRENLEWTAELFGRSGNPQKFRLVPRTEVNVVPGKKTTPLNPRRPFAFAGVTANGDTVRSTDERFRGKALVIDIMGTWCHNCMDAAPLLEELAKTYRSSGLEVVGLCYELKDDFALAARNLELYQKRYGITFTVLYCGSTQPEFVDTQLKSQLNDFYAYPTTIFSDKKGRIREIHVGFRGPGTGDQYQAQIKSYHEIAAALVR